MKSLSPGIVQIAEILRGLVVANTPTGPYRVGKYYAEIIGIKASSPSERAKRGQSELYAIMKCQRAADPVKAWAIFEALRRAGLHWCSGVLGLFAGGHLQDVVGVVHCVRRFCYGDPWWADRLEELVTIAPIAARGVSNLDDNSRWTGIDVSDPLDPALIAEARDRCTIEEPLRDALDKAWTLWLTLPRDLATLSVLDKTFPAGAYAAAGNLNNSLVDREVSLFGNLFWFDWLLR